VSKNIVCDVGLIMLIFNDEVGDKIDFLENQEPILPYFFFINA